MSPKWFQIVNNTWDSLDPIGPLWNIDKPAILGAKRVIFGQTICWNDTSAEASQKN